MHVVRLSFDPADRLNAAHCDGVGTSRSMGFSGYETTTKEFLWWWWRKVPTTEGFGARRSSGDGGGWCNLSDAAGRM